MRSSFLLFSAVVLSMMVSVPSRGENILIMPEHPADSPWKLGDQTSLRGEQPSNGAILETRSPFGGGTSQCVTANLPEPGTQLDGAFTGTIVENTGGIRGFLLAFSTPDCSGLSIASTQMEPPIDTSKDPPNTPIRVTGSLDVLLVVFNGFDRRGQGSTSARFENQFGGGTVGVALTGHVVTGNEPQELVATIRDTRGKPGTQVYTNVFINNTGLTPAGSPAGPVNVELTARANSTGVLVGNPIVLTDIGAGQSRVSGSVLTAMGVQPSEDTILVFARVTSGNAAIAGVVSVVDPITQDGSVLEMSRADF